MHDLYNKTTKDNFSHLKQYVEDVAHIGKNIKKENYGNIDFDKGFTFQELTGLLFYIAIQEDINYPEAHHQGRKMCFYRYLEDIYCRNNHHHTINEAIQKATARGYIPKNWNDVGNLYDNIEQIQR